MSNRSDSQAINLKRTPSSAYYNTMNSTSNSSNRVALWLSSRPTWQVIVESTLMSVIDGLALVGNILVWGAVLRNSHLRKIPTNLFILSLSLSDILMSFTCIPVSVLVLVQGRWSLGTLMCQVHGFIFFVLAFVSLQTVALVALNRYLSVAKQGVYRRIFTYQKSILMIMGVWFICILYVTIFVAFNQEIFFFDAGKIICHIRLNEPNFKMAWNIITGVLFALLPMITLFLCYFKLFRAIQLHNLVTIRSIRRHDPLTNTEEIRVTKVIVAIMLGFSCCWLPSFAIAYLKLVVPTLLQDRTPHLIYIFLVYSSSMINPFIYGILNSTFRGEFLKIILCGRRNGSSADTEAMEMKRIDVAADNV